MSDMYIPSDPKTVPIRPMTRGMFTDRPTQAIDVGGGVNVEGYDVTTNGCRMRQGFLSASPVGNFGLLPVSTADGTFVSQVVEYFDASSTKKFVAITDRAIYHGSTISTMDEAHWVRPYTSSSVAGTIVNISGSSYTFTADRVRAGHIFEFTTAGGLDTREIISVAATAIELVSAPTGMVGSDFTIHKRFAANEPYIVQYAQAPQFMLFCDGTENGIIKYDGSYLSEFVPHDEDEIEYPFAGCTSIAWISGRLLVGGTVEDNGRQRARWSSVSDITEFDSVDYVDFAMSNGSVVTMGMIDNYPVIFLQDDIYSGTPYGYNAPLVAPWNWSKLDTGGAGIVGPRAFTRTSYGLIYGAREDFYLITNLKRTESGNFSVEPMHCAVLRETLRSTSYADKTVIEYDPEWNRILIGMYQSERRGFNEIYYYHFDTKAWSWSGQLPMYLSCIGVVDTAFYATWASIAIEGTDWANGDTSWASYGSLNARKKIMAYTTNYYPVIRADSAIDQVPGAVMDEYQVVSVFETGDIDFDLPDEDKSCFKLALRIGDTEARVGNLVFNVEGSTNKGRTWKVLGTATIGADEDEEELHFRLSGVNMRFRITLVEAPVLFTLEELTLRLLIRAGQVVRQ